MHSKTLTSRDQNRSALFTQQKLNSNKPLKFQRVKRCPPSMEQTLTQKKHIHDSEQMRQMIQELKEDNNNMRNILKVQQTQIAYFQEQEKNSLLNEDTVGNGNKKVELHCLRLKKQVKNLQKENEKMKKTLKMTNIKQLQTINKVYAQQITALTGKVLSFEKSTTNIIELNKVIQNQFMTDIKNKELLSKIDGLKLELQQSFRINRKLKNTISMKNGQIEAIRAQKQKVQAAISKNKNMDEYVHKSQFIAKKKQLLAITQNIEKLQIKLAESEAKVEALHQENIDNMNRQTLKRKELLVQYNKCRKSHESLQEALSNALKKNESMPIKMQNISCFDHSMLKTKAPRVVTLESISQTIKQLINIFQQSQTPLEQVLDHITSKYEETEQEPENKKITLRQLLLCLEQSPFSITAFEQRECLGRYLTEDQNDECQFIDFDKKHSLTYVKSILKRALGEFPIYNQQQVSEYCLFIQDFLKRNQSNLMSILVKIQQQHEAKNKNSGNHNHSSNTKKFKYEDILEAIQRENELSEDSYKFIQFWTFENREQFFSFSEFEKKFLLCEIAFIQQDGVNIDEQNEQREQSKYQQNFNEESNSNKEASQIPQNLLKKQNQQKVQTQPEKQNCYFLF